MWLALLWYSIYCSGLKQNLLYLWSMLISHVFKFSVERNWGFPDGSVVKSPPASVGSMDSIPGLGRSPRVGNGSPLQYSCLENPMDRGSWSKGLQRVWHDWRDLAPTHISIFYFLLLTNWGSSVIFFWLLFLTFLIGIINQSKVKKRTICDIWGRVQYNIHSGRIPSKCVCCYILKEKLKLQSDSFPSGFMGLKKVEKELSNVFLLFPKERYRDAWLNSNWVFLFVYWCQASNLQNDDRGWGWSSGQCLPYNLSSSSRPAPEECLAPRVVHAIQIAQQGAGENIPSLLYGIAHTT